MAITDGYQFYQKLGKERKDLTIGVCCIYVRRPYADFIKSLKEAFTNAVAHEAYAMITDMLHIDNGFDDLSSENV